MIIDLTTIFFKIRIQNRPKHPGPAQNSGFFLHQGTVSLQKKKDNSDIISLLIFLTNKEKTGWPPVYTLK